MHAMQDAKGLVCGGHFDLFITVEPRFNEPLFNEVLDITKDILCPCQSYSKMYGIEPRYNEFFDITNIIQKPKRKIRLPRYNELQCQHATEA